LSWTPHLQYPAAEQAVQADGVIRFLQDGKKEMLEFIRVPVRPWMTDYTGLFLCRGGHQP
jgi:hypothetical protein